MHLCSIFRHRDRQTPIWWSLSLF